MAAVCLMGCDLAVRAPIGRPSTDAVVRADAGWPCEAACAAVAGQTLAACVAPGCESAVVQEAERCLAESCGSAPPSCEAACAQAAAQQALACALVPHTAGACAWRGQVAAVRCASACVPECVPSCAAEVAGLADLCRASGRSCAWAGVSTACERDRCASVGACLGCDGWLHDRAVAHALMDLRLPAVATEVCGQALCRGDCAAACALVGVADGVEAEADCWVGCASSACVSGCGRAAESVFVRCRAESAHGPCMAQRDAYFIECAVGCE
jgi:hypothetical protein